MNEQIKQLELEAIAYADSKVPASNRYNDIYHSIVRGKFAELIVRECANLNFRSTGHVTTDGEVAIGEMINKHFGVEE